MENRTTEEEKEETKCRSASTSTVDDWTMEKERIKKSQELKPKLDNMPDEIRTTKIEELEPELACSLFRKSLGSNDEIRIATEEIVVSLRNTKIQSSKNQIRGAIDGAIGKIRMIQLCLKCLNDILMEWEDQTMRARARLEGQTMRAKIGRAYRRAYRRLCRGLGIAFVGVIIAAVGFPKIRHNSNETTTKSPNETRTTELTVESKLVLTVESKLELTVLSKLVNNLDEIRRKILEKILESESKYDIGTKAQIRGAIFEEILKIESRLNPIQNTIQNIRDIIRVIQSSKDQIRVMQSLKDQIRAATEEICKIESWLNSLISLNEKMPDDEIEAGKIQEFPSGWDEIVEHQGGGEQSSAWSASPPDTIYFLVQDCNADDPDEYSWYGVNISSINSSSSLNKKISSSNGGSGGGASPCCKMEQHFPIKSDGISFGSWRNLLFGLGGLDLSDDIWVKGFHSFYYYDTLNPERGWIEGPPMLSPRHFACHRVINDKLYVMAGVFDRPAYLGYEPCRFPWAESLDLSEKEWTWRPLVPPHPDIKPHNFPNFFENVPPLVDKFDPQRHILSLTGEPIADQVLLCYDIEDAKWFRVCYNPWIYDAQPFFVDGDYVYTTGQTYLDAVAVFENTMGRPRRQPILGLAEANILPPPLGDPHDPSENPFRFSIVQIGPSKYATLWWDKSSSPCGAVRLAVFTIGSVIEEGMPVFRAKVEIDWNLNLADVGGGDFHVTTAICSMARLPVQHLQQK